MCGIVGYIGKAGAATVLINGLRRLEYRCYDSAGIAILDDDRLVFITIPACHPLVATIPAVVALQWFAYHVARLRGCDIDRPRNLAKSVTVE